MSSIEAFSRLQALDIFADGYFGGRVARVREASAEEVERMIDSFDDWWVALVPWCLQEGEAHLIQDGQPWSDRGRAMAV